MICERCKQLIKDLPIIEFDADELDGWRVTNKRYWHISCADENSLDEQMKAAGLV